MMIRHVRVGSSSKKDVRDRVYHTDVYKAVCDHFLCAYCGDECTNDAR